MMQLAGSSRFAREDASLDLDIKNFGPIASASISLRPLTVFIGPNNSGKSYAARLLHSIMGALTGIPAHAAAGDRALSACRRIVGRRYDAKSQQALLGTTDSRQVAKALIEEAFCDGLRRNMERNFESPAVDLVRAGQSRSTVTILEGRTSGRPRLRVDIDPQGDLTVAAGPGGSESEVMLARGQGACMVDIFDGDARSNGAGKPGARERARARASLRYAEPDAGRGAPEDRDGAVPLLSSALVDAIAREVQWSIAYDASFYLPAGRSAIMQTYRDLAAGMITNIPRAWPSPDGAAGPQGAVADLVAEIIRLRIKRKDFFGLARSMEREMLSGSVQVSRSGSWKPPVVSYRSNGINIPLPRASSSISEIAPLSLYLKYVVGRRSVLVIEEPETHLHPANEVILAKYVVRLVRAGLCVVLTTHSPYMLEKLAKYALAGGLPARDRVGRLGYGRDDYLASGEVSAYLFKRARSGACHAVEIERDDECGISQEEFSSVDVELNRESIIIQNRKSHP